MHIINLYQRTTFKYRDAYRELDDEVYVGDVKMLGGKRIKESSDFDDGGIYRHRIIAPRSLANNDLSIAIGSYFSGSNCRHEWDCCGCAFTNAFARRISKREYIVEIKTSYNY